jgi:hypothetical protein
MFRAARAQVVGRKNRGCEKAQRSAGVNCAQSAAGGPKYSSRAVLCHAARTAPVSDGGDALHRDTAPRGPDLGSRSVGDGAHRPGRQRRA